MPEYYNFVTEDIEKEDYAKSLHKNLCLEFGEDNVNLLKRNIRWNGKDNFTYYIAGSACCEDVGSPFDLYFNHFDGTNVNFVAINYYSEMGGYDSVAKKWHTLDTQRRDRLYEPEFGSMWTIDYDEHWGK